MDNNILSEKNAFQILNWMSEDIALNMKKNEEICDIKQNRDKKFVDEMIANVEEMMEKSEENEEGEESE